jgi:rubrerythrin
MAYNPSNADKEVIKRVYDDYSYMRNLRNNKYKYFNDRSLKDYVEDSQLRLNGYVPTREEQGKESWQSNVFHPITKNKFKASLAAVALDVPQTVIVAQNDKQDRDTTRAELIKNLVRFSYDQENKEEQVFFEAWEASEKGTVIVYDGYLKSSSKKKIIKSYDPETGEIETEEQEVETENGCVNFIVPLMNLYIKDWNIFDIQKQPALCWIEKMDVDAFKKEFGKYPKFKDVEEGIQLPQKGENDTFFYEEWKDRVSEEEPVEVIRYYNKGKDEFVIIANGVKLFESPLILGKKKKWYPFAKTVFEPFATDFFYGNSFPNTLMGEQDVINALFNMAIDKTYKSMAPALLIGNTNKDDFDLEDQNTTIDTKIYVQDINQVREMPITGVNQSDVKMIDIISRGLDLSSVDSNQQGVAGRGVTAREVVIANENAKKLKGILYMFLKSLWIQKIRLRIMNIMIYYTQPKVKNILGEGGKTKNILDDFQNFAVEDVDLSDGSKGIMDIQMYSDKSKLPTPEQLTQQENDKRRKSGINHEILAITNDYLDDWIYDVRIESESIYQTESSLSQMKIEDKLRILGTYFPQLMMVNTNKLFKDTLIAYEDDPDEYTIEDPQAMIDAEAEQMGQGQPQQPGANLATAGQQGMQPLPPQ